MRLLPLGLKLDLEVRPEVPGKTQGKGLSARCSYQWPHYSLQRRVQARPPDSYPPKDPGSGPLPGILAHAGRLPECRHCHPPLACLALQQCASASAFAPHGFSPQEGLLNNFPTAKYPLPFSSPPPPMTPSNTWHWSGGSQHPSVRGEPRATLTGNRCALAEYSAPCQEQPACWTY